MSDTDVYEGWTKQGFTCKQCGAAMFASQPRTVYGYGTRCTRCSNKIAASQDMYHCWTDGYDLCTQCAKPMMDALKISRFVLFKLVSDIIPKEYIVYAVTKDRHLLIRGYLRQNTRLQIARAAIDIIDAQCKLSYDEFNATVCKFTYRSMTTGWDDEDTWTSGTVHSISIKCNGNILDSNRRSEHEVNPYGKEKSSAHSNEKVSPLRVQNMEHFLSMLQKLPIEYKLDSKGTINTGISFNNDSTSWTFDNCYQSQILRNTSYRVWNEENVEIMQKLMTVLETKYKADFHGVDLHKLIEK